MAVKVLQEQSIKLVINEVKKIVEHFQVDTSKTILSISGGYGLNCPTNTELMNQFHFKSFLGIPCISDCGISLGIGLYHFYNQQNNLTFIFRDSYYGNKDDEIEYYLYNPQLQFYDIRKAKEASLLSK